MSLRQTVALSFLFVGREDPMITLRKGWETVGLVRPHFALGRASSVHFLRRLQEAPYRHVRDE